MKNLVPGLYISASTMYIDLMNTHTETRTRYAKDLISGDVLVLRNVTTDREEHFEIESVEYDTYEVIFTSVESTAFVADRDQVLRVVFK